MKLLQEVHNGNLDRLKQMLDESGVPSDHEYSDYMMLRYALWRGHRDIAKLLIEKGCRVNRQNLCSSNTPLHIAVKQEDAELVQILLDKGARVESVNHHGETPLHYAAKTKNDRIIELVLESASAEDRAGLPGLHVACMRNDPAAVEQLLRSDASTLDAPVTLRSPFWPSYTPLHFAVEYGRREIVQLLLERGADIAAKNLARMTPLHLAVRIGETDIVDAILAAHARCPDNPADAQRFSHFHAACARGRPGVVEGFLARGGLDVDARVAESSPEHPGFTALHFAVQHGRAAAVALLLRHRADASAKNAAGMSPLHLAVARDSRDIVDLILAAYERCHTELNPVDERGFSHFHAACTRDEPAVVRLFLRRGVRLDEAVSSRSSAWPDYSALHLAVEGGCARTVEVLLEHGARLEAREARGMSPLHLAVLRLDEAAAGRLLRAGADVNARSRSGTTPLHLAVERGRREIVRLLLAGGADVNCAEALKLSTPLHLATLHKHFGVIDLLLASGARVHARERDGKTAVHTMALRDPKRELDMDLVESYSKIIASLLAAGCDIDSQDGCGRTPLHVTCLYRNLAGAYALLQHGADINIEDNIGKTPLLYCMHVFHNIYYIFQDHIEKLRIINFPVSDKNQVCLFKLKSAYKRQKRKWNEMEHDVDFTDRCHEELKRMKSTKIDNYWSLYNIIFRDANGMALHIRNDTLKKIVESSDFDKTFALYGYLIKLQMKRGVARSVLMGPAIESLHFCIGMEIPVLCSETILKYLTNDQLDNLIKAKA